MRQLLAPDGEVQAIDRIVMNIIGAAQGNARDRIAAAEFLRDTVDGRPAPDSDGASGPAINVNVMTMSMTEGEE